MRAVAAVLAFVLLTGCGTSVEETTVDSATVPENGGPSTADVPGADAVVADAALLPVPALDRATFAARLKEDFYFASPDEAQSITLSYSTEKDFILDNLALLSNLVEIEFSGVWLSEPDYAKVAPFRNVTTISFRDYEVVHLADLMSLPFVTGVELHRCREITWAETEGLGCRIRHVSLHECPLDATGMKALVGMAALESLNLSDIDEIDDDTLALLANSSTFRSLAVYNCPAVEGDFLAGLKGLRELRELKFTGPLPAEKALHLASFPKLRAIALNIEESLPEAWYQA
ncbi:MAG: hypothetical protein U1E05_24105, partial [Patescibacteria group bacterium]|nr:hypothetical protein [Patescibacteria group bacterium]